MSSCPQGRRRKAAGTCERLVTAPKDRASGELLVLSSVGPCWWLSSS